MEGRACFTLGSDKIVRSMNISYELPTYTPLSRCLASIRSSQEYDEKIENTTKERRKLDVEVEETEDLKRQRQVSNNIAIRMRKGFLNTFALPYYLCRRRL